MAWWRGTRGVARGKDSPCTPETILRHALVRNETLIILDIDMEFLDGFEQFSSGVIMTGGHRCIKYNVPRKLDRSLR